MAKKKNSRQPKPTSSPYVLIKKSKIHGSGGYAKKNIPAGVNLIEYVGERITKKESDLRGPKLIEEAEGSQTMGAVYLFELNSRHDLDGNVPWNTARYINHSCDPNCESDIVKGKVWIRSIKEIKKGEELTYNYGYDIDCYDEHPCRCGTDACVGYIVAEDYFPEVKRRLAIKRAHARRRRKLRKSKKR